LKFRNFKTLYQTVYRLTQEQAFIFKENNDPYNYRYQPSDFVKSLNRAILKGQIKLPPVSDYQFYTTEIKLPPLKDGFYLIVMKYKKIMR